MRDPLPAPGGSPSSTGGRDWPATPRGAALSADTSARGLAEGARARGDARQHVTSLTSPALNERAEAGRGRPPSRGGLSPRARRGPAQGGGAAAKAPPPAGGAARFPQPLLPLRAPGGPACRKPSRRGGPALSSIPSPVTGKWHLAARWSPCGWEQRPASPRRPDRPPCGSGMGLPGHGEKGQNWPQQPVPAGSLYLPKERFLGCVVAL